MSRMKSNYTQNALLDVFAADDDYPALRSTSGFDEKKESKSGSRSRLPSPEEWREIWIGKTRRMHTESSSNQLPSNTQRVCEKIERYLKENPYPPTKIYIDRARGFIRKGEKEAAEALLFFYATVVPSRDHVDAIRECSDRLSESASQTTALRKERPPEGRSAEISAPVTTHSRMGRPPGDFETNRSKRHQVGYHFLENAQPEELLERLREEIRSRDLSWNTLRNYMAAVRRFLKRANSVRVDPGRVFKQHLIYLRDEAGLAASTVNQHAAAVSFFFEEVLGIEIGPDRETRMKTGKPLPRVHSQEEVAQILKAPRNEKHRLILMLTYGCGLRLGEVQCIKRTNIHLDRKVISVEMGKGKKDRYVMLDDDLAPILRDWLDCGSGRVYLFEGYCRDKPLSRRSIEKVYSAACEKCDIPSKGGIHSLRHSFGTHLLEQGVNLRYIQELLGHSSPKTTEIYTHVAANKISQIRSPIAGMFRKEDSKGPNTP